MNTTAPKSSEARPIAPHPASLPPILDLYEEDHKHEIDERRQRHTDYYAAGRILLASLFILTGLIKLFRFDLAVQELMDQGVQDAALVLPIALLFELIGGSLLAIGYRTRAAAAVLAGYLFTITVVVNWDLRIVGNQEQVMTNVALIGALLMAVAYGGGAFSLDRLQARREHLRLSRDIANAH